MNYSVILLLLLTMMSCNSRKAPDPEQKESPATTFKLVAIPKMITQPEERAAYLVAHYWDHLLFTDTTMLSQPDVVEQAFADYIDIMGHVSTEKAASSIQSMLKKAEANKRVHAYFAQLYEKYLYDPNSPMRNETLYIPVLEAITGSPNLEETDKIRPLHLLKMALKNRPGEVATDFKFTTASGAESSLHKTTSDYLLIYFYNPDCQNCKEVSSQLIHSALIKQLTNEKRFNVLALYPDEDLKAWKENRSNIPHNWINAYDKNTKIRDQELYDLKAIPTLYLLDKAKKVLLKDVTFEQLELYFAQRPTS